MVAEGNLTRSVFCCISFFISRKDGFLATLFGHDFVFDLGVEMFTVRPPKQTLKTVC